MTSLYLVSLADDKAFDLFVRAKSSRSAVNFWRSYYNRDSGEIAKVYTLPSSAGALGAFPWETIPMKAITV